MALLLVKIKSGSFSWPVLLGIANRRAVDATLGLKLVADAQQNPDRSFLREEIIRSTSLSSRRAKIRVLILCICKLGTYNCFAVLSFPTRKLELVKVSDARARND